MSSFGNAVELIGCGVQPERIAPIEAAAVSTDGFSKSEILPNSMSQLADVVTGSGVIQKCPEEVPLS